MLAFVEFAILISLVVDIHIWEQETTRVICKLNDMYFMHIKINEINNQNNMIMLIPFTRLFSLSFFYGSYCLKLSHNSCRFYAS
jgi:hypothetical protein